MKKSLSILLSRSLRHHLSFVRTIPMPVSLGDSTLFGVDVKGHRLFVTPLDHKTVEVYDLTTGQTNSQYSGYGEGTRCPLSGRFKRDIRHRRPRRIAKIFKGDRYALIKAVKPLAEPDGILYDPATHYLYIYNRWGECEIGTTL